ncbi:MAG: hypothetical protein K8R69_12455 [Deltaproteobacteria bacterium]|nr:hypothetical protein [Deltaproteobacteria bacterium]
MTPPIAEKVDIQALDSLHLEKLVGMDPHEAAKRFHGTDLKLDAKTSDLRTTDGKTLTSCEQEATWVAAIRSADTNGDHFVDLEEIKNLLRASEQASAATDPRKFLASIARLVKNRYEPLSKNMHAFRTELAFQRTIETMELYNQGLLNEGYRHASSTIAFNGLAKTAANLLGFVPGLIRRTWSAQSVLMGDQWARETARKNFEKRRAAIGALKGVITKGIAANATWALEGRLEEAMKRLDDKTASMLNDQLAAPQLHEIFALPDPKERYKRMLAFARQDRPGFLGFGTGNTRAGWLNRDDPWNVSGHRYNTYFSRTVLHFLATKASSGNSDFDEILHKEARATLSDMNGDGGDFNNLGALGLLNLLSIGGLLFEPTPYRDWSDESSMDALGRMIDGVFLIFAGNRSLTRIGEATKLSRHKGLAEVARVWQGAMAENKSNLLAGGKWGEAALAAEKEGEVLGLGGKSTSSFFLFRLFDKWESFTDRFQAWVFQGNALSAEQKAMAEAMGKLGSNGMDKLTRGALLGVIANYGDSTISPRYNPFEHGLQDLNRQSDFERYEDPTRPAAITSPHP